MPIIERQFDPAFFHKNGHISTIATALLRSPNKLNYQRETIHLPDGDFLDLDWSKKDNTQLMILVHGLEGDSSSGYILGMGHVAHHLNMDVVAINLRGCSDRPNKLLRSYHSGATEDIEAVIQHILKEYNYEEIHLSGFSLGGNLVLKYVGEQGQRISSKIKKVLAVSVPVDLKDGALTLCEKQNVLYHQRFLSRLIEKMKAKKKLLGDFPFEQVFQAKNLIDFDHSYTAPAHGFKDAWDYYQKASSKYLLEHIQVETLLINAYNDPFFTEKCLPFEAAQSNDQLYLMAPQKGGHVGFKTNSGDYFTEIIAHSFFSNQLL